MVRVLCYFITGYVLLIGTEAFQFQQKSAASRDYALPEDFKQRPMFDFPTGQHMENNFSRELNPTTRFKRQSINCPKCKCGLTFRHLTARVVAGVNARRNEFPWMVLFTTKSWFPMCGASLISDKYAVTAAHCTQSTNDQTKKITLLRGSNYRMVFGVHDRSERNATRSFLPIKEFIRHEDYTDKGHPSDIALIRFDGKVIFSPKIYPICIPQAGFEPAGMVGTVAGWGRQTKNSRTPPNILQKATLPILSNNDCYRKTVQYNSADAALITPKILCAGNSIKSICNGDSGGPLMITRKRRTFIVGINSLSTCDATYIPNIFTRVTSFSSWIMENVESDTCFCRS